MRFCAWAVERAKQNRRSGPHRALQRASGAVSGVRNVGIKGEGNGAVRGLAEVVERGASRTEAESCSFSSRAVGM